MGRRTTVLFVIFLFVHTLNIYSREAPPLTAPVLSNNPSLDVIITTRTPLLSFFNASGGAGERTYDIQLGRDPDFKDKDTISYRAVPETGEYVTGKRDISHKLVEDRHVLNDSTVYHWRVRAVDSQGNKGPWAKSRFFVDTSADDKFMGLVRVPVKKVEVSSGQNPKNITDLDDPGQVTFWRSSPPGKEQQWVKFVLEEKMSISRIWMLSNPKGPDGWLEDFVWQTSVDGEDWMDIEGAGVTGNDSLRNIIDFEPVETRYLRLYIERWNGYAPQINVITFYSPGMPDVPDAPEGDYVLLVGNQQNGFTFSELADFVEDLDMGLKTLTVPHYEVSMSMVESLDKEPVAIILSGNNAGYANLPMFEYNGEYELIRQSDIPILGICCGHQQIAMAYGYTNARSMGWEDISAMQVRGKRTEVDIVKGDPVFTGIKDPFTAVEIHGWAVAAIPEGYELLARSSYVQAIKSTSRMIYGEQFHGEIKAEYNQGKPYIKNFLRMALRKYRSDK
jgi:GMP synthase-like glutamine amidotransferase